MHSWSFHLVRPNLSLFLSFVANANELTESNFYLYLCSGCSSCLNEEGDCGGDEVTQLQAFLRPG